MFNIDEKNRIKITRGDTAFITISVDGYEMAENDKLTFSVKYDAEDTEYLFTKQADEDNVIHIEPQDTKNAYFDKYIYDIQLTTTNGDVFTIIEPTTFNITKEVTI